MHGETTGCLLVSTAPPSADLRKTLMGAEPYQGPKSNPAKLPIDGKQSIYALFAQIFRAAIDTTSSKEPVRFLSRYDKSAANIAESRIWATIGQTPWADPYSPWYHRFVDFPFQALRAASRLGEYAIMDRGTWCAVEPEVRDAMAVFVCLPLFC
jgi:ABC-type tungstate transport system permease subunit